MRLLIAGSSGFLGTRLTEALKGAGHEVVRLVRHAPTQPDERRWDPYGAPLGVEVLDNIDVVVNLAGSPLVGNPYSAKWRHELERSRVVTTSVLAEAIAAASHHPAFLAGNATGFYGPHGDQLLDESSSSSGSTLLSRVCQAWQDAAQPAVDAGSRVVYLRTSPVLDKRSEPLRALSLLFKLGLGGRLGPGDQYFPTISSRDWVRAVVHCATTKTLSGPVNLTLERPATNADFTKALGSAVHRPTLLPVPGFVLKPATGDLSPELLGSVRLAPRALLDSGFVFDDPDIGSAVRAGLSAAPPVDGVASGTSRG